MNENTFELLADLKSMRATIRVMDENKKGYLERIAFLEDQLASARQLPEGYVLVPVDLTDDMCEAVWDSDAVDYIGEHKRIHCAYLAYTALLAAAPKPE